MADDAWIQERITKTKTLIVAYEDAILALANGAQSYSLDTGQTRMTKTQADLASMRLMLKELETRLQGLEQQLSGSGGAGAYVVPGF